MNRYEPLLQVRSWSWRGKLYKTWDEATKAKTEDLLMELLQHVTELSAAQLDEIVQLMISRASDFKEAISPVLTLEPAMDGQPHDH